MLGPHPYPLMVREFQSVIGREARAQILEQAGRLPDAVVACVGGGSNAIGIFDAFIDDADVRLIGVEAGGEAIARGRHAARFAGGSAGVLQGTRTFVLQDEDGNIELTHSISAGLDYAAVGPEHAWLRAHRPRRVRATSTTTRRSTAFQPLARLEGILPALESAHAIAYAQQLARELGPTAILLVNLSGRGDKDVHTRGEGARRDAGRVSRASTQTLRAHRARSERPGLVTYVDGRRSGPARARPRFCRRWIAPAPTCSRSACRSRIRSPTVR